jgi:hypothetical protein
MKIFIDLSTFMEQTIERKFQFSRDFFSCNRKIKSFTTVNISSVCCVYNYLIVWLVLCWFLLP